MEKRKTKLISLFQKIMTLFLLAVILYCCYTIGLYLWESYNNNKLNDDLHKEFVGATENNGDKDRFRSLLEINPQVVGWIKIDQTKVDYPVLKAEDNEFYLHHNINKQVARAGSIFMDYRNEGKGEDKNTIIYGHHMKDGSMFKDLMGYKKEQFFVEHPLITFDTMEKVTYWEIFSVYITEASYDYVRTDFIDDVDYENFLKEIKNRSLYDTGIEISKEDNILTLSTCTYEFDDARLTVHGKLMKDQ